MGSGPRTASPRPVPPLPNMIVATHQPIFLPWPGFFAKALRSDCLVLLDDVQFPRGRSWMTRNRLKNEDGELWLTVPVWKTGRSLQAIRHVEICNETGWRRRQLQSIRQNYVHAPGFDRHFGTLEAIFARNHRHLAGLNIDLIRFLRDALSIDTPLLLQSDLGIQGTGTDLLIRICRNQRADRLAAFPIVEKHLDLDLMRSQGIELVRLPFHPPVYPQLWGDFLYNLSTLDLLLNCGDRAGEIVARSCG